MMFGLMCCGWPSTLPGGLISKPGTTYNQRSVNRAKKPTELEVERGILRCFSLGLRTTLQGGPCLMML